VFIYLIYTGFQVRIKLIIFLSFTNYLRQCFIRRLSVCYSVCLLATSRKKLDWIFVKILRPIVKILPHMYLWTRKSSVNFGSHPGCSRLSEYLILSLITLYFAVEISRGLKS